MNNDLILGILGTLGTVATAYLAYKVAWVNKIETPEQKEAKQLENENAFAKMHNDLLSQYRTRNAELELEVSDKDKVIANLDAIINKMRIDHAESMQHEKKKKYEMERERNAAFAALEANQRIIRVKYSGKPVEYEPPNGTTPGDGSKVMK